MPTAQKLLGATAIAVLALTLAGCSPTAAQLPANVEETPTVPAIDPGPITLSEEEAADRYLGIVCQSNVSNTALTAAFQAGEDEFFNGGAPDPAAVKAAAQVAMDDTRVQVELIDDTYYVWPEGIGELLPVLRDSRIAGLGTLSTMVNAVTYEEAYYAVWPDPTAATTAAQEIRYQLGLDADTTASCVGHETAAADLLAEKTEREEALAKQ